jgi:hypothetical protein
MYKKIVVLSLLASLISPVFSQDLKKGDRTCRLIFPEKPSDSPRFIYLYDGKDNHRLYLSAVNFSDVVELETGDINLVMTPEPVVDPENIPPEYPKLSVPKGIRNFYIYLSVDEKNKKLPLKMKMINLDSGKFDPGNTLWCNFTNHRIVAKLGDSQMSLAAGKTTISEKPLSKDGYYKAQFQYQPNSTGDFRRITEQSWWFDADCRYVGFIADRGGMLPKIYFFRDFRNPKPTKEEAKAMTDAQAEVETE